MRRISVFYLTEQTGSSNILSISYPNPKHNKKEVNFFTLYINFVKIVSTIFSQQPHLNSWAYNTSYILHNLNANLCCRYADQNISFITIYKATSLKPFMVSFPLKHKPLQMPHLNILLMFHQRIIRCHYVL